MPGSTGRFAAEALKPAAESALREWTVSPRLNRTGVGDDDPTIIEPTVINLTTRIRGTGYRPLASVRCETLTRAAQKTGAAQGERSFFQPKSAPSHFTPSFGREEGREQNIADAAAVRRATRPRRIPDEE
jgi:hypothetical protein